MPPPLKKSFAAEQLKQRQKKSPATIILVVAIIVAVTAFGYALYSRFGVKEESTPETEEIKSIAVLPFVDMSADKDQEYFCDGIAEEIINTLSKIDGIRVIARTSSFEFKGRVDIISEISRKLDVDAVLEGSLRKEDNRVRITAQLINVADESHLWSDRYDRELESVFDIQEEISLAIVEALKGELLGEEKTAIEKRPTENLEAYNLYFLGRHYWKMRTEQGFNLALEYFQQASDTDPNYALAYAGIADAYHMMVIYGFMRSEDALPKARAAVEKALEIDDTLAEAHTSLAMNREYDWENWTRAEEEHKRAIELNANYATAHHRYSYHLMCKGRHEEAIKEAKIAQELDPLSPVNSRGLGIVYFYARQYDLSLKEYNKAIEMNDKSLYLHTFLFYTYHQMAMYKESVAAFAKYLTIMGYGDIAVLIEQTYAESGYIAAIRKLVDESMNRSILLSYRPLLFSIIGENEHALELLEKAYEERNILLFFTMMSPLLDDLRSDPRFKALQKKMGLE